MLITDSKSLEKYKTEYRLWQGIPSIEVTPKGRMFVTFYSGGKQEEIGNYVLLVTSDDQKTFSEPVAVAYKENCRCFDPCLWIDPLGRLWFTWSCMPERGVYGVICEDPDAETLVFGDVFWIGSDVMMNKPTVLSTGEWLFPIAVWDKKLRSFLDPRNEFPQDQNLAFVYKTADNGKTFERLGGVDMPRRSFDEHMTVEMQDGRVMMLVRTEYGIGKAYSYDGGKTFGECEDSMLGGPCSRFLIRRLPSGRLLLVNHVNFSGRNNLTALLSEDDGETWKYSLMLDTRSNVSYPDLAVGEDGYLYIVYDRERGAFMQSMDAVYASAREILYAKITEKDIMAGKLVSSESELQHIVSKLGEYLGEDSNPFAEFHRYSDEEKAEIILSAEEGRLLEKLFGYYPLNCVAMRGEVVERFDALAASLEQKNNTDRRAALEEMIRLLKSLCGKEEIRFPIVDIVKRIIVENGFSDLSVADIARKAGISVYYMMHLFKKETGITVIEYRNALKIAKAKELLVHSSMSMTDIAQACGICTASYFSKMFMESEHMSPKDYRNLHKASK